MRYIFPEPKHVSIAIHNRADRFPVRRVFCVGRNYAAHAREMGSDPKRDAPFFFMKPNDALVTANSMAEKLTITYPPMTQNLHFEVELVLALNKGGNNIPASDAMACVYGFGLGLDLTRRDLQNQFKERGQPWDMAKGFDQSAPISPIMPKSDLPDIGAADITLAVNGQIRQQAKISDMIWNMGEIIEKLSAYVRIEPGDLIFTGTPDGVGAIIPGDALSARLSALQLDAEIIGLMGN